jgi:prevent-host-death family protein
MNLQPDLITGVVPISRAASALAALIAQARTTQRPIIVTQKGYPAAFLLSVELFDKLRAAAEAAHQVEPAPADADVLDRIFDFDGQAERLGL